MSKFVTSQTLLEPIKRWFEDDAVSEIVMNEPHVIFIERGGRFISETVRDFDSKRLQQIFQLIANENQQELNGKKPILSGVLQNGMRVQLVIPPVSRYYCFAIRKKRHAHFSLEHLNQQGYFKKTRAYSSRVPTSYLIDEKESQLQSLYRRHDWPGFLRLAIQLGKNIVISGATSSGKTTFLNACLNEISLSERLLILEDTSEIDVKHKNSLHLLAPKSDQISSSISMQQLLQCSLRLRPDRIIVGEVRGKEVLDFIAACLTGHNGAITTVHAENPQVAFTRMCQMYKLNSLPAMTDQDIYREIKQAVDIVFQLKRVADGRCLQSVYYRSLAQDGEKAQLFSV